MKNSSIYKTVRAKLITHGVDRTADGRLTLTDAELFSLFVQLERVKGIASFDGVLEVCAEIEAHVAHLGKRQLIVFAYMYLSFSDLAPRIHEPDEVLPDRKVRKSYVFGREVSDEEMLIGLWARVKYEAVGEHMLRLVRANG
ncbi:hypothetical protein GCM10007291_02280 [Gemmobacter nanjingensis]|uniref:Uncharacterized protein n=1 Tax=Gemmobacter nanjingensis TaxID=488454 RepID=A0ABQ3F6Q9_9RHOB|nr:hypothetical protein [Gemmobacter nanjingensis]GHC09603.1 hypothetical protein GCM10007291_02280 [Gemmobacter nanjingensis]